MFKFFENFFNSERSSHYKGINHVTSPLTSSTTDESPQELSSDDIAQKIVKLREIFGYQLADSVITDLLSKYKTVDGAVNAYFDNNTYIPPVS